jgi:hypothetical protein
LPEGKSQSVNIVLEKPGNEGEVQTPTGERDGKVVDEDGKPISTGDKTLLPAE